MVMSVLAAVSVALLLLLLAGWLAGRQEAGGLGCS
jgi:hypothetical protein